MVQRRQRRKMTPDIETAFDELRGRHETLIGLKERLWAQARKEIEHKVQDAENARDIAIMQVYTLTGNKSWITEELGCDSNLVPRVVKERPEALSAMAATANSTSKAKFRFELFEDKPVPKGDTWVSVYVEYPHYSTHRGELPIKGKWVYDRSTSSWVTHPSLHEYEGNANVFSDISSQLDGVGSPLWDEVTAAIKPELDTKNYRQYMKKER